MHFNRYLVTGDRRHLEPVPRLKARTERALAAAEAAAHAGASSALGEVRVRTSVRVRVQ